MKLLLLFATALGLWVVGCEPPLEEAIAPGMVVDVGPEEHLVYRPEDVDWQDGPASLESGAMYAVLEGDLDRSEVFTMQIKMPDGFQIAPHWHPNVERVTVLSGVFYLGSGDEMDMDAAERLEAGTYTSMPPEMRHYAFTEGRTIIQLTTIGPWVINYLNPEDDPRLRD